jgi:hypothetical protein
MLQMVSAGGNRVSRLGGIRANAARLSYAELDVAEELDICDPDEFGFLHVELSRVMPNLRVFGGAAAVLIIGMLQVFQSIFTNLIHLVDRSLVRPLDVGGYGLRIKSGVTIGGPIRFVAF